MIQEISKISKTNSSELSIIITWLRSQSQWRPKTVQKWTLNWQSMIAKNVIYQNDILKPLWDSSTTELFTLTWSLKSLKSRISTISLRFSTLMDSTKIIQPGRKQFHLSNCLLINTITEAKRAFNLIITDQKSNLNKIF